GPNLRTRLRQLNKRIIGWNGVGVGAVGVIDVDAQDGSEQITDVLPGTVREVGRIGVGRIARGEIKKSVRPEGEGASVVPAAEPTNENLLATGFQARRSERGKREPRYTGALGI